MTNDQKLMASIIIVLCVIACFGIFLLIKGIMKIIRKIKIIKYNFGGDHDENTILVRLPLKPDMSGKSVRNIKEYRQNHKEK